MTVYTVSIICQTVITELHRLMTTLQYHSYLTQVRPSLGGRWRLSGSSSNKTHEKQVRTVHQATRFLCEAENSMVSQKKKKNKKKNFHSTEVPLWDMMIATSTASLTRIIQSSLPPIAIKREADADTRPLFVCVCTQHSRTLGNMVSDVGNETNIA